MLSWLDRLPPATSSRAMLALSRCLDIVIQHPHEGQDQ